MRVYVLPDSFGGNGDLVLSGKDAHYLTKVLRMKEGSLFAGRDKSGRFWDLKLTAVGKGTCTLCCTEAQSDPVSTSDALPSYRGPFPPIHLYQGLCKGKKMEQIVRQATELGVTRIIPFSSRSSVIDLTGKEEDRRQRLVLIAKEALQQSGSPVMTEIAWPIDLSEIPGEWGDRGTAVLLHQVPKAKEESLPSILRAHRIARDGAPVALVVGPEGGFSDEEASLLTAHGFHPVMLKTNILRAETAAIVATAIVQHLLIEEV
ncbi:MAG: RsmE family RNA methyltransferase [Sphaerochaetaceae bacterium]|jgi:16S rRNA (uracil1498-N3)-methyltransferase|nr:RsmE family RNA methyltransferase [Sphaerochaetaceae bacterium]